MTEESISTSAVLLADAATALARASAFNWKDSAELLQSAQAALTSLAPAQAELAVLRTWADELASVFDDVETGDSPVELTDLLDWARGDHLDAMEYRERPYRCNLCGGRSYDGLASELAAQAAELKTLRARVLDVARGINQGMSGGPLSIMHRLAEALGVPVAGLGSPSVPLDAPEEIESD